VNFGAVLTISILSRGVNNANYPVIANDLDLSESFTKCISLLETIWAHALLMYVCMYVCMYVPTDIRDNNRSAVELKQFLFTLFLYHC
jgi:hypothetical protein